MGDGEIWLIEVREDVSPGCGSLDTPDVPADTVLAYLRDRTNVWLNSRNGMQESWESFANGSP